MTEHTQVSTWHVILNFNLVLHSVVMSSNKAIQPLHREIQILTMSVAMRSSQLTVRQGDSLQIGSPPAGLVDLQVFKICTIRQAPTM